MLLAVDLPKSDELYLYSNPVKAQTQAFKYLGKNAVLYKSQNVNKKICNYRTIRKNNKFWTTWLRRFYKT